MDSKWPFMLITFGLVLALGLTIAGLERTGVMNNWDSRRCDFPVMTAAMFFKPDSDPRTSTKFTQDNFNFCMKSYIDKFMNLLMIPVNALFDKQLNLAGSAINMVDTVRQIAATMYAEFSKYLTKFFGEFNRSVYEISRIIQYFRMAMGRANAMAMSMLYMGITMFRGMINAIQFIIKVILIICGIMLAIIIILIFVLFPFIPMILAVLGSIVAAVLSLTMIIGGSLATEASNAKSGFCFSETSEIIVKEKDTDIIKSVKDIKIGDELGNNCGKVTAIILMSGKDIQLYNINGVIVSGSHLVLGTDMLWKCVSSDERAKKTDNTSNILYCFNTTTHTIPVFSSVFSSELQEINNPIMFRDWEEFDDNDQLGEYIWTYTILKMLNNNSNYSKWKDGLKSIIMPLMGNNVKVKTNMGFMEISAISSLWCPNMSMRCLTRDNEEQDILGVVSAEIDGIEDDNGLWNTELYEWVDGVWIKGLSTVKESKEINGSAYGMTLITDSGEFIIWDETEQKEKIVRDFTEIGYKEIYKTYSLVSSRLRLLNQ